MRVMAIDYGDARTGVAVSDLSAAITGDAWVIHSKNSKETAQIICTQAKARGVGVIVVGYPKNMDGTIGPRAEKCEAFAQMLRNESGLEVALLDERMTTKSAHRILTETGRHGKKRKNTIDAVAASLILESYINSEFAIRNSE